MTYFGKIIAKQGNKPEIDILWRHPYVILHLSNSLQHQKVSLYLPQQNKVNCIGLLCKYFQLSEITEITLKNQSYEFQKITPPTCRAYIT